MMDWPETVAFCVYWIGMVIIIGFMIKRGL